MKYKIYVNLNRIDPLYLADFELARLYHLKHGVDIQFVFNNIDIHGYTSAWSGSRWIIQGSENLVTKDPTADVNMFVFDQGEWATPAGSPFPLLPNTPTGSCGTITKPFINIGTYLVDHNDGQTWIEIAHEIMHSLVQTANLKGYKINDVLDSYYLNSTPDAPNGNFAQDWALLKPFLDSQNNIVTKMILIRGVDNGVQVISDLALEDKSWGCKTLELAWKNNQVNISAIPKGTYTCQWKFMARELRYRYQIMNVPGRTGIFFHSGNYFFSSQGCIILGSLPQDINHDKQLDLINSGTITTGFEQKMNKRDFILVIQ